MPDETAPQPPIKITWLVGTLAAFALFAVIAGYSSRMTWDYPDYDQQRAAQRYDTLAKLQQDEGKLIDPVDDKGLPTAEWVDQAKGVIRIPIEEAMDKEIDTLQAQPVAMGAVISAPAPAKTAPAAGAPASTNAAPGAGSAPAAPAAKNAAGLPTAGATNAAPAAAASPFPDEQKP